MFQEPFFPVFRHDVTNYCSVGGERRRGGRKETRLPFTTARQMNTVCRFLCGSFPQSYAKQQPGTNGVTSDASTSPASHFPFWPPRCAPDTPPLRLSANVLGMMKEYYLLAVGRSGRDPSSGPRRLKRTPVAVHLLPAGEGKQSFLGHAMACPYDGADLAPDWAPLRAPIAFSYREEIRT